MNVLHLELSCAAIDRSPIQTSAKKLVSRRPLLHETPLVLLAKYRDDSLKLEGGAGEVHAMGRDSHLPVLGYTLGTDSCTWCTWCTCFVYGMSPMFRRVLFGDFRK